MTNEAKLARAKAWMRERGIQIKAGGWKGPANPLPNLANKQPTIACYDAGILGQWRSILRLIAL